MALKYGVVTPTPNQYLITSASPIDPRSLVDTFADLIDYNGWKAPGAAGNNAGNVFTYFGMQTTVAKASTYNDVEYAAGVYQFLNNTGDDSLSPISEAAITNPANWVRISVAAETLESELAEKQNSTISVSGITATTVEGALAEVSTRLAGVATGSNLKALGNRVTVVEGNVATVSEEVQAVATDVEAVSVNLEAVAAGTSDKIAKAGWKAKLGFVESTEVSSYQAQVDWNATEGVTSIANKPNVEQYGGWTYVNGKYVKNVLLGIAGGAGNTLHLDDIILNDGVANYWAGVYKATITGLQGEDEGIPEIIEYYVSVGNPYVYDGIEIMVTKEVIAGDASESIHVEFDLFGITIDKPAFVSIEVYQIYANA